MGQFCCQSVLVVSGSTHTLDPESLNPRWQGEANADQKIQGVDQTEYYSTMLQSMIADWRERKGMGDFAFITMQLPPSVPVIIYASGMHVTECSFQAGTDVSKQMGTGRMQIRLAEAATLPHTNGRTDISGMAVGIDMVQL